MDFNILQLREIPFVINNNATIDAGTLSKVKVTFVIMLQHQRDNNAVCLHTALRYLSENNEELMHGGASIVAHLPGWQAVCQSEEAIRQSDEVEQLINYASAFVSGQFFHFAANTSLSSVFVPWIPAKKLINNMIIEAFDPMKEQ
ncbi:MAG: hypothetical protein MJZ61_09990 [Bacteroidales bacterium]|nr:hypothetical protein [Bacteroidales bacterium]